MLNKAVIYTRVSDPAQIKNNSLETQKNICESFAKRKELEVIKVYREEGKSAKDSKSRDELKKLMLFCAKKSNNISTVIVYKMDRFSRNLTDALGLIAVLSKYGVRVISATEPFEENAIGKAVRNMMLVVGELDNGLKSERVRDNMQAVFRKGLWPFKSPVGYKRKYNNKEQNRGLPPIPDKNLTPIITQMFKKASEGIYSKMQLARIMNLAGFKDFYGKKADHKIVRRILNKTFYYGLMYAKKWDEEVLGRHEPMIDEETWQKAYHKVILKKKTYKYSDTDLYPLKGSIHCEDCGEVMTTSPSKGSAGIIHYYECKGCRKLRANRDKAHDEFFKFLKTIKPSKRAYKLFEYGVFKNWDKVMSEFNNQLESMENQISSRKEEIRGIRKAVENEIYTKEEGKEEADKLRAEIAILEVEKSDLKIEHYDKEAVQNFTKHFMNNLGALWKHLDLPKKQALQQKIFPNGIYWTKDKKIRTGVLSPSFQLIKALEDKNGNIVTPREIESRLPG